MKFSTAPRPSQVYWLMAIGLMTFVRLPQVNFPGFVPIPNSPISISYSKILLKAFPKSPFGGSIPNFYFVVIILKSDVTDAKNRLLIFTPSQLYEVTIVDADRHRTLFEKSLMVPPHSRNVLFLSIDIEARCLFKLGVWGESQTQHISFFACEIKID